MQITCNTANTLASNIISCVHFMLYLSHKTPLVTHWDVMMSTKHSVCFSRYIQSFSCDRNRLKFIQALDRVTEQGSLSVTCDDMSLVRITSHILPKKPYTYNIRVKSTRLYRVGFSKFWVGIFTQI